MLLAQPQPADVHAVQRAGARFTKAWRQLHNGICTQAGVDINLTSGSATGRRPWERALAGGQSTRNDQVRPAWSEDVHWVLFRHMCACMRASCARVCMHMYRQVCTSRGGERAHQLDSLCACKLGRGAWPGWALLKDTRGPLCTSDSLCRASLCQCPDAALHWSCPRLELRSARTWHMSWGAMRDRLQHIEAWPMLYRLHLAGPCGPMRPRDQRRHMRGKAEDVLPRIRTLLPKADGCRYAFHTSSTSSLKGWHGTGGWCRSSRMSSAAPLGAWVWALAGSAVLRRAWQRAGWCSWRAGRCLL